MQFAGMNYLAIVAAAAAAYVFSAVYYTLLSRHWLNAAGLTRESARRKRPWLPFVVALVADLVLAWILAGVVGHLGLGQVTVRNAMISGAFVWLGFVLTTIAVNNAFAGRKPMLTLIDAAHWLGVLLVAGLVIGLFGI